ncbi:MAG: TolC family protein [Saprospiraceae bacterium]|nr:TolC family protein [Saprospiraceae bacterium]
MLCSIFCGYAIQAQTVSATTLEDCQAQALSNYPLIQQAALLDETKAYTLSNLSRANWTQIILNGQATYQSEVTSLPIVLPGISVPSLSKDQYKLYADVYQPLTEFRNIRLQKDWVAANLEIEKQKIAVELYKIKDRINQLYFGILLINAQTAQAQLLKQDLRASIDRINVAIANGAATPANRDLLQAEVLKIEQKITELQMGKDAFLQMLSAFTKQTLTTETQLAMPTFGNLDVTIRRPELKLFDLQKNTTAIQQRQIANRYIPKIGLFGQVGFGRPALNFLSNAFDFYYIGGLRLSMNFSSFYTEKNEKQLLRINDDAVEIQRQVFLLNTQLSLLQQNTEIGKFQMLIQSDKDIIALRESIKQVANIQLENGIITTTDYLSYLNAEDQAKQNLILHTIQLLLAKSNLSIIIGN